VVQARQERCRCTAGEAVLAGGARLGWIWLERKTEAALAALIKNHCFVKGALNATDSEDGVCVSALNRAVGASLPITLDTRQFHAASSSST
jgi:hypothetical protein